MTMKPDIKPPPFKPTTTGTAGKSAAAQEGHPLYHWWVDLWNKLWPPEHPASAASPFKPVNPAKVTAKDDAKHRLRLVLMHDRSQLSSGQIESMRDELVEVISKYVEIDRKSLDLYLEQEADTIALVANISVVRRKDARA